MTSFTVTAVAGIGEVTPGADLAALLLAHSALEDGDIVVVTSKVVSKAEGRLVRSTKDEALAAETDRLVARRGPTWIVRTHHGLVMAAAGIDASNTAPGTLVLLPQDPDRSARALRDRLHRQGGVNVAVVVSDTSGRAWRNGQTDIAIGVAGLPALDDHAGRADSHGTLLAVTAPAIADEMAAAGDLAKGKLGRTPVAVVRGLGDRVLTAGQHGPGARVLVRDEANDMFGYGAREAVLHALADDGDGRGFGAPAPAQELAAALGDLTGAPVQVDDDGVALRLPDDQPRAAGRTEVQVEAVARSHGWREVSVTGGTVRLRPGTP